MDSHEPIVLNVAGNRGSSAPALEHKVMLCVIDLLAITNNLPSDSVLAASITMVRLLPDSWVYLHVLFNCIVNAGIRFLKKGEMK